MGNYGAGNYGVGVYATPVSAVEQDVWPARVLVTVTGLLTFGADTLTLYREVAGERTEVRAAAEITVTGQDAFVRVDAELPFGVPLRYVAVMTLAGGALLELGSATLTVQLAGGKVALTDAIAGEAAEVVVLSWPAKTRARRSTAYQVGGRNVVVTGPRAQAGSTLELFVETDTARQNLDALLGDATSGVVQIRQPGGYSGVDAYLAVLADTEARWSQDGTDQRRTWTLDVVEVDGWPPAFEDAGFTLQDVADTYTGLTLFDLSNDYATLLALAQGDFGGA